ncbi:GPI ethanolamine phosphate transferase 3 [Chelonus insularis]|uniref:GPI ethanolamine phosphate transferase 3 n=1 Tax=Chelonus insularis TaxID=460826 RepID=UPI00158836F7|nr:GPI ethanolamine phosphate transferase 3 [Chelonus insularis]
MVKIISYFIFLTWISYLMISGLLLFINGFFLTRIARMERSNCTPCYLSDTCNAEMILQDPTTAAEICLEPRAKVVLLVVDALKYEFMHWQENISNTSYYHNKIPIVHELLEKYPMQTRLYKSIAEPPTTTMQRLKALTTGTLPTFIDISSNFASEQINEDNLIDQLASQGIVFMGDDTWTNLFPGKYLRQFPSPSFNVWDLDTVDREVRNRIFFELQKKDWSLLIAHTLGVDHCGHKHGQNHPEMARKLSETNSLIEEIIEVLDEKTVLFVIGDHGMTESGDHGGDSPNEVEAAMFVYSKTPLQKNIINDNIRNQIDIVPTLASILGSPTPFSNLGSVILDVIPSTSKRSDFWFSIHSLWRNIYQTKKYIDVYSSESLLFTDNKLEELNELYKLLAEEVKTVDNNESFNEFVKHSQDYLNVLRDACVKIWVQFDSNLMLKGLLLMFCTLFFAYLIINNIPEQSMTEILESYFLRISVLFNGMTLIIVCMLYCFQVTYDFINTLFFSTGVVSLILLVIFIIQNWEIISTTWYNNSKKNKFNYFTRVILLLTFCGLFSNSYVIEENKVLSFLLITIIWLFNYNIWKDSTDSYDKKNKMKKPNNPHKYKPILVILTVIVCLAIRMSSYFWRCREEQNQETCASTLSGKVGSITSNGLEKVLLTIVSLALLITVIRIWLKNCGNLTGFSLSTTVVRYSPGLIVVCIGCYWILQQLPKNAKMKFVSSYQMDTIPLLVYFIISFAILILFIQPLQVFLLPQKKDVFNLYQGENIVPKLFDKVKELFYIKKEQDQDNNPIIYGLGTVYSATFISVAVFFILLYALLLGNILASSVFLMIVTCIIVLGITTMERYRNANDIVEFFQISTLSIFCWFLIAEYFFYGTGHQPTFPTIHWDAAFIGTGGHFYGHIIPAILIGINTFGSHIILGFTLPLLVIVPFTIYIMIPKLVKKFRFENDMKRGELILFDKELIFHNAVFSVAGKYLLIHGFRTFGCMLAATIHCRHLMVWKIFAPKLIFEGLSFLVSVGSVLTSLFMVMRIDNQVEQLITRVTKSR